MALAVTPTGVDGGRRGEVTLGRAETWLLDLVGLVKRHECCGGAGSSSVFILTPLHAPLVREQADRLLLQII